MIGSARTALAGCAARPVPRCHRVVRPGRCWRRSPVMRAGCGWRGVVRWRASRVGGGGQSRQQSAAWHGSAATPSRWRATRLVLACQPTGVAPRPARSGSRPIGRIGTASQRSRLRTGHGSAGAASRWRAPAGRWAARPLLPAPRGGDTRARTAEAPVPPPSAPQGARR